MSADQLKNITDIPLAIAAIVLVVYVLRFISTLDARHLKAMADRDCRYEQTLDSLTAVIAANTEAMKGVGGRLETHDQHADERTKIIISVREDTSYIRKKLDEHHGFVTSRGE